MHSSLYSSELEFFGNTYTFNQVLYSIKYEGKKEKQQLKNWVYMKTYCWIHGYILTAYNLTSTPKRQDS